MTITTTPSAADPYAAVNAAGAASPAPATQNDAASADRFLKLLVAQMQHQDPLNPMDNAQVTTQMAQISTVDGIQQLNSTVKTLQSQLLQTQVLQGASLVGREVVVAGNGLAVADGVAHASFDLAGAADRVQVEILDASGRVADTVTLPAQKPGTVEFTWDASKVADPSGYTYRVSAKSGAADVAVTPYMDDRVDSVGLDGGTLTLELERAGRTAYTDVRTFH